MARIRTFHKVWVVVIAILFLSQNTLKAQAAEGIWDKVKGAASDIYDDMKEAWPDVKEKAGELWESGKEKAKEAQQEFSEWREEQEAEFWERTYEQMGITDGNSDSTADESKGDIEESTAPASEAPPEVTAQPSSTSSPTASPESTTETTNTPEAAAPSVTEVPPVEEAANDGPEVAEVVVLTPQPDTGVSLSELQLFLTIVAAIVFGAIITALINVAISHRRRK